MIKVPQSVLGAKGDCFQACIASLLEIPLSEVPDLCAHEESGEWVEVLNEWLKKRGLCYMEIGLHKDHIESFFSDKDFLHIRVGRTKRHGTIQHAVVYRNDTMVHDPHPSNDGLLNDEDAVKMGCFVRRFM